MQLVSAQQTASPPVFRTVFCVCVLCFVNAMAELRAGIHPGGRAGSELYLLHHQQLQPPRMHHHHDYAKVLHDCFLCHHLRAPHQRPAVGVSHPLIYPASHMHCYASFKKRWVATVIDFGRCMFWGNKDGNKMFRTSRPFEFYYCILRSNIIALFYPEGIVTTVAWYVNCTQGRKQRLCTLQLLTSDSGKCAAINKNKNKKKAGRDDKWIVPR